MKTEALYFSHAQGARARGSEGAAPRTGLRARERGNGLLLLLAVPCGRPVRAQWRPDTRDTGVGALMSSGSTTRSAIYYFTLGDPIDKTRAKQGGKLSSLSEGRCNSRNGVSASI